MMLEESSSPASGPNGTAQACSADTSSVLPGAGAGTAPAGGLERSHSFHSHSTEGSFQSSEGSFRRSSLGLSTYVVDPRRAVHKYIIFLLLCSFIPGPYFMDSIFIAYKGPICKELGIRSTAFGILLALPSATGVFAGVIGPVIARLGEAKCACCAGGSIFFAALCMNIGVGSQNYFVTLIARLFFWCSLNVLLSVQMTSTIKLFSGQALSIATGVTVLTCRAGGMLGSFLSGFMLDAAQGDPASAMYTGVVLVAFATAATALFAYLRRGTATVRAVLPLLEPPATQSSQRQEVSYQEQFRGFTPMTWWVIAQISCVYATVFPFENIAFDYFGKDWGMSAADAGMAVSPAPMFGMFAWIFGIVIKTEKGLTQWGIVAWIAFTLAFIVLGFQLIYGPAPVMFTFGVAYAFLSTASWALIPVTLPRRQDCNPAAVSLCFIGMSLSQSVSNVVAGILHDLFGYFSVCIWFTFLALCGVACAVMVMLRYQDLETSDLAEAQAQSLEGAGEIGSDTDEAVVAHIEIACVQSEECYFEAPCAQSMSHLAATPAVTT